MDIILLIVGILAAMTISLIAIHLWVGIWDTIIAGIKKLFCIGKKETINWHTLDESKVVKKSDTIHSKSQTSENERLS